MIIGLLVGFLTAMALVNPLIQRTSNLEVTNHPFGWVPNARERRKLRRKNAQDGQISKDTSHRQIEEIWEWTDENNDGYLSVTELTRLVWMTSWEDSGWDLLQADQLINWFGSLHPEFKKNNNTMSHAAFINQYEREGAEQVNHDHAIMYSTKFDELFQFADVDKDGTLSAEEVRQYIRATEGFGDHDPRVAQIQTFLIADLREKNPNLAEDGSMTRDGVMKHYAVGEGQLDHDYEVVFNNAIPDSLKSDVTQFGGSRA